MLGTVWWMDSSWARWDRRTGERPPKYPSWDRSKVKTELHLRSFCYKIFLGESPIYILTSVASFLHFLLSPSWRKSSRFLKMTCTSSDIKSLNSRFPSSVCKAPFPFHSAAPRTCPSWPSKKCFFPFVGLNKGRGCLSSNVRAFRKTTLLTREHLG